MFAATPALHLQLTCARASPEPALLPPHLPLVSPAWGPAGVLPLEWLCGLCWARVGRPPSTWGKVTENLTQQCQAQFNKPQTLGDLHLEKGDQRDSVSISFNHIRPQRTVFG